MPAAIVAARRGARVALVEAADRIGGTLHLASGSLTSAGSAVQTSNGLTDGAERHYLNCLRLSHGSANPDILRLWTRHAGSMTDWLHAEGVDLGPGPVFDPAHALYDVARSFNIPGGAAAIVPVFERILLPLVEAGRIDLRLSTRMTGLLRHADGGAAGIAVESGGKAEVIYASSTVLTTGGYANDDALWTELHPHVPRRVHVGSHARGDGFRAARELGAAIDYAHHFLPMFGACRDPGKPEDYRLHSMIQPHLRLPWEIIVNTRGQRFVAEDNPSPDARERALMAQPDQSFWVIYDERIRRDAPPLLRWSEAKVKAAFRKHEDFVTAPSIEMLADACGIDRAALARTIAGYNEGVSVNSDVLGRTHLPALIREGPFYAIRHYATSVASWGGLVVNDELEVLREDGNRIPNLHAAGEVMGMGVFGHTYLGGAMLSASLTFGKLLGEWLAPPAGSPVHPGHTGMRRR